MGATARKIQAKSLASRQYAPYLEALWGIKNHWYPATFTKELPERGTKGVMIAGHEIVLRRSRGKVYALQDRCIHRWVKMSDKPLRISDDHMTCWYHGFCYGLEDGVLRTIVGAPEDPIINQVGIRTYPVQEVNGIIFLFVGDPDYKPVPPLTADLPIRITDVPNPPGYLLDQEVYVRGIHRTVNSNWRLAVENGFDPGHILIHYDNILMAATEHKLYLGAEPLTPEAVKLIDEPNGPKGIMNMYYDQSAYRLVQENPVVKMKVRGKVDYPVRTSIFLPGVLLVENWPLQGWAQYEWYVPTDDQHHEYWEVVVNPCHNEEQREEAEYMFENAFEKIALRDFNDRDIFAREAMQPVYGSGKGWDNETLCSMDTIIVGWRKLVSQHNRGIQEPPEYLE
jgi:phenylpropionate dioxygenase-like ring-hydroxylating dioxygenase large terminal subunit